MKKREFTDLANKSKKELEKMLKQEREELGKLVLGSIAKKSKNTSAAPQKRKNIARLLTFMHQKELSE